MSSVGRAMLTMKKAVNGTWPRLLKARAKRPGNMHVWWSMKEKYEKENTVQYSTVCLQEGALPVCVWSLDTLGLISLFCIRSLTSKRLLVGRRRRRTARQPQHRSQQVL